MFAGHKSQFSNIWRTSSPGLNNSLGVIISAVILHVVAEIIYHLLREEERGERERELVTIK